MRNWNSSPRFTRLIRQQWKPALIALFFMFLTLGFLLAGVGCNAVSGLAKDVGAMSDGIARSYTEGKDK